MAKAFIIMPIGNTDLDDMCSQVIIPALVENGFNKEDCIRIDKHNEGGLLKSEIIQNIDSADIIIADLTNERPNCYLEVGVSMGMDKYNNLLLMAKEDHNPGSPNHIPNGPKIHFDLIGYDILFWDNKALSQAKVELSKRVRRRLGLLSSSQTSIEAWNHEWVKTHQDVGILEINNFTQLNYLELIFSPEEKVIGSDQSKLKNAAIEAQLGQSAFPIGRVYDPQPKSDGISDSSNSSMVNYWTLGLNGDYYLIESFSIPDEIDINSVHMGLRMNRIIESLLFCERLYGNLGVTNGVINIKLSYRGLKGKQLYGINVHASKSSEDELCTERKITLDRIRTDLPSIVMEFGKDLLVLFGFFSLKSWEYQKLVDDFQNRGQ